jgi:hypothetical protein
MPDGSILRSFDASCGCEAIFVAIGFVAVVVVVVVDRVAGPFFLVVLLVLVAFVLFETDAFCGLPCAVDVVVVVAAFGAGACDDVGWACCSAKTGRAVKDATATSTAYLFRRRMGIPP